MELETRKCTNSGCKRTFRVITSSKQITCSNACTYGPNGPPPGPTKPKSSSPRIREDDETTGLSVQETEFDRTDSDDADSLI